MDGSHICKPTATVILNSEIPLRSELDMMPTFATSIQYSTGSSSQSIRREKKIKGIQIRKEEVKLSLFTDDITLKVENPK